MLNTSIFEVSRRLNVFKVEIKAFENRQKYRHIQSANSGQQEER
jgi:hypothetical protein